MPGTKDEASERVTIDADQDVLEELGASARHSHVRGIRDPVRSSAKHPAHLSEAPCSTSQRSQGLALATVTLPSHLRMINRYMLLEPSFCAWAADFFRRMAETEYMLQVFFCKYNDPIYVKMEKLDVLVMLANDRNIDQVLAHMPPCCVSLLPNHFRSNSEHSCIYTRDFLRIYHDQLYILIHAAFSYIYLQKLSIWLMLKMR
jgi:hypothetical protein